LFSLTCQNTPDVIPEEDYPPINVAIFRGVKDQLKDVLNLLIESLLNCFVLFGFCDLVSDSLDKTKEF